MCKKMTLAARAVAYATKDAGRHEYVRGKRDGYIAGHRANRLTRAERAVVKAAVAWARCKPGCDQTSLSALLDAVQRYEIAKGGAR
jgi:hypothetical protein